MTRKPAAILAFLLLAFPLGLRAQALEPSSPEPEAAADPARVAEIRVEGNRRVEAAAIRNALATKAGAAFSPSRAAEDLRGLWRLGFFSDVQLLVDEGEQSTTLVVRVEEKPAVREVKVRGNKELSDEDLKDIVDIKPFSILNMAAVRRNARKLQDKYVEKGYFLAEVSPKVEQIGNNEVNVFLDANEHAKVQVKRITFAGNKKLKDSVLKDVMQTEEGGFLSFLTSSGTFREEVFQRDVAMLQGAYYDRGFVHVRIGQPQISMSADKRFIYINVPVTEGEQYSIGKVDVSGDLIEEKAELRKKLKVEPGELFNRSKLQQDIMALTEVYYDAGYAYANVSPQTSIDPEKRIVDLSFEVQKGEKIYIERIEITGNHKTRDKVIRRELRVFEGELFSGSGLRASRQRVTALGFFENVDVTYKKGSRDDTLVVAVDVKEKPTGTFQVGLGFSSFESFLFTAQVSQNNIFGWGQTASLAAQISGLRTLLQMQYYDPYFFDSNWIFSFNFFRQELDYFGFIRESTGGDITWGYHLTPDLMVHLGYAPEYVNVTPSGGSADLLLARRFRDGFSSALRLTANYDRRDNRLFPTSGHYESFTVEHSPEWLGADFKYTRYSANARYYQPIVAGLVLKAQGTVGYIKGMGEDIPISELFYLGGINSVRGYQMRSLSPELMVGGEADPTASLRTFTVGGNKQAYFNFELEFPIFDKVGIRGVLFYDMGNVFAQGEQFFKPNGESLPLGMRHAAGFGFRWFSPIGPLRFEWGIPLNRRPQDEDIQFEFTIGNFF
jgi:outer membrane protein insertion porin family